MTTEQTDFETTEQKKLSEFAVSNLPELIFGIVGPIGVDIDTIVDALHEELNLLDYKPHTIRLTQLIPDAAVQTKTNENSYAEKYDSLIEKGNQFRKACKNNAAMAALAVSKIVELRKSITGSEDDAALSNAYIVRQFKRQEEIELLRKTYGRKFVLISAYGSRDDRLAVLIKKIKDFDTSPVSDATAEIQAIGLIEKDGKQKEEINGQNISECFHLGDVFIDGIRPQKIKETIKRFIYALFGKNNISPTKDEFGLYMAAAASLRSIDLSRQVGAAIFNQQGDVISVGCNEVPKPFGGQYWCDDVDVNPLRDFEQGIDKNESRKREIVHDLILRMSESGFLPHMQNEDSVAEKVRKILEDTNIKSSQIMDIIEFGRIIHAEMAAITDAARLGRSVNATTLFCTTFPCHMCAKHIVSSGIRRVVFLEPYPKSYAKDLHGDSITFDPSETNRVVFEAFVGISPRRYRDIFEKKKRKDQNGKAIDWHHSKPAPMIEDRSPAYLANEPEALAILSPLLVT